MRRKSLLIPILVFISAFSVLSFYQKFQITATLANTTDLPPVLWSKTTADISKITYSVGSKEIIAQRQDDTWYLANFNNKKADNLYIYTIMNGFLEPKLKKAIASDPKDLTAYGIDKTSATLTLYDNEGKAYIIQKGNAIDDKLSYVYTPATNTVYSVETSLFNNLSITESDWMNKQLLSFNMKDVHKVTFSYKGMEFNLSPVTKDDHITLSGSNINPALSEKFANFLLNSKIQQFIADNANDHVLSVYGFDNPSLRCTITLNSGDTLSLIIGDIKESENICYAMVNHNGSIVAVPYFDFSQFDSLFADLEANNTLTLG